MNKKICFTPLYLQIKQDILSRIMEREWGPSSFLPNEFVLAEQYSVSQGTLCKALHELTTEKHLIHYQGKGTAVAVLDEDSSLFPFFLLHDRHNNRVYPSSHLLNVKICRPAEEILTALGISDDGDVLCIECIRLLNSTPVINEYIYIPSHILPVHDFSNFEVPNTLYAYYQQQCGAKIMRAAETIEAVLPNDEDITRLNVKKNCPLLAITRTSYSMNDKCVEFRVSHVNSAKHIYMVELK